MFCVLNAGTAREVAPVVTPSQVSVLKPLSPELPNALERYTNGGGPLNEPMPPRTWLRWSPVTSQLMPMRGEICAFCGSTSVERPYSVSTVWLSGGAFLNDGLSQRTPAVTVNLGVTVHASCA